jgi:hypothetical protein
MAEVSFPMSVRDFEQSRDSISLPLIGVLSPVIREVGSFTLIDQHSAYGIVQLVSSCA